MYFQSLRDMLEMGGHGIYVWSAYAVSVILIMYMILSAYINAKNLISEIDAINRIENHRAKKGAVK